MIVRRALAGLALFVIVNILAAALAHQMTPPLDFYDWVAQDKRHQLAALERGSAPCVQAIILGNSLAIGGIDPVQLGSALDTPTTVYNAALFGTMATQDAQWARDYVLPALDPGVVIHVVTPFAFSADAPTSTEMERKWNAALETSTGPYSEVVRFTSSWLPLVRNRSRLSSFDEYWGIVTGERPESTEPPENLADLTDAGFIPSDAVLPSDPAKQQDLRNFVRLAYTDSWTIDDAEVAALVDFTTEIRRDGRIALLVVPPMSPEFPALLPHGSTDYERYVDMVLRVGQATDAPVIDLRYAQADASAYYDHVHVGGNARVELTDELARQMNALPIAPTCGPRTRARS